MKEPPDLYLFHGDWESYEDEIYGIFVDYLVNGELQFRGQPVACPYHPASKGKHFSFWHLISEGKEEDERTPDIRRCERIYWVPWMIENAEEDEGIKWWENRRGGDIHIVMWLERYNFVVVLGKRKKGYCVLKTCYIADSSRRRQLRREIERFWGRM